MSPPQLKYRVFLQLPQFFLYHFIANLSTVAVGKGYFLFSMA